MKKIIIFFIICFHSLMWSQAQYLDPTFGNQGSVSETFSNQQSRPAEVLRLENGKFLVLSFKYEWSAGMWYNFQFYLSCYNSNGQLDTSFGTNGFLIYPLNSTSNGAPLLNMIRLNDGKILVHCFHESTTKLIKFTSSGVIDSSFGQGGEVNLSIGDFYKIIQTKNNDFILMGQYFDGYNNMYHFAKLNANGVLDTSFGTNGKKVVDITTYRFDLINSVKYTQDNKIIIAGMSYDQMTTTKAVVSRFTTSGNLDTSFGTNGLVTLNINTPGNNAILHDVAVQQNNGKIVICGDAMAPGGTGGFYGSQPFLASINSNGTIDQQFGTNGIRYFSGSFNANDSFHNITFHNNDILISGSASLPYPYMITYYYYRLVNGNGADVTSFGTNGVLHLNLSNTTPEFTNYIKKSIILNNQVYGLGMSTYNGHLNYATTFFKLKQGTLNVSEIDKVKFTIYPNPVDDFVTISGEQMGQIQQIKVIDVNGKTVKNCLFNNESQIEIDLLNLNSGVYFINIYTINNNNTSYKIIKK